MRLVRVSGLLVLGCLLLGCGGGSPAVSQSAASPPSLRSTSPWDAWIGGPDVDVYQLANDGVFDPFKPEIVLPEALDDSKWMEGFDAGFSDKGKKFTYDLGANGGGR